MSDWLRRDRKQIFTFRSDSEGCEHQFTEGEQEPPPDAHTTYFLQLRNADLSEQLNTKTTNSAELENKFDDCSYELNKTKARNEKLETLLVETQSELSVYVAAHSGKDLKGASMYTGSERKTLDELQVDLL